MGVLVTSCVLFFGTVILITWFYLRLKKSKVNHVEFVEVSRLVISSRLLLSHGGWGAITKDYGFASTTIYIDPVNYAEYNDLLGNIDYKHEAMMLAKRYPYAFLNKEHVINVLAPLGSIVGVTYHKGVWDEDPVTLLYAVELQGETPVLRSASTYCNRVGNGELDPYIIHQSSIAPYRET